MNIDQECMAFLDADWPLIQTQVSYWLLLEGKTFPYHV